MNAWLLVWTIFLVATLALFAGIAIVITVRGFFDVRDMLRRIARTRPDADGSKHDSP